MPDVAREPTLLRRHGRDLQHGPTGISSFSTLFYLCRFFFSFVFLFSSFLLFLFLQLCDRLSTLRAYDLESSLLREHRVVPSRCSSRSRCHRRLALDVWEFWTKIEEGNRYQTSEYSMYTKTIVHGRFVDTSRIRWVSSLGIVFRRDRPDTNRRRNCRRKLPELDERRRGVRKNQREV